MSERSGYKFLKRALYGRPHCLIERIENAVSAGTPDVYTCVEGVSAWFETKELTGYDDKELGDRRWRLRKVTPAQPPWWARARACGVPLYGILNFPVEYGYAPMVVSLRGLVALVGRPGLTIAEILRFSVVLENVHNAR
jgi:hypothetical protein